jgi:apolipoprotein N-acyltransferase
MSEPDATRAARPAAAPAPGEEPHPVAVRAALVLLSVALLWLALPPVGAAPLALVAMTPFLLALRGLSPRLALRVGIVFGTLSAAANAHWFFHVFPPFFPPVLFLIIGLFPALFAAGYAAIARRGDLARFIVAPALWVGLDWFRSEGWNLKFAWFTLGHALAGDTYLRQNADVAGVYGLSLLAFVVSLLLARAIECRRDGRVVAFVLLAVAIPLTAYARGNRVVNGAPTLEEQRLEPGLRVLAIQDEHPDRLEPKLSLTKAAVAATTGVDVILWPEDSFFRDYTTQLPWLLGLESVARLTSGAFVFGSMREGPKQPPGKPTLEWNAAVVLDPTGRRIGEYHKRVPVQFVESCLAGDESPVFPVSGTKLGCLICYDGTYPFVTRGLVQAGACVLLIPTMDVAEWGKIQHAHHALFYPLRACEVRRPIVRAASSGVSLAVDAWGRELARVEPFAPGSFAVTVQPDDELTPYVRGGWLLPFVALGIVLVALLLELGAALGRRART